MTGQTAADFVVLHHIQDPSGWAAALDTEHNWPDGFDLRSFVEDEEHELAVCVWTAPSREELQESLDGAFGHAVVNEIHAVTIHLMRANESGDPEG